MAQTDLAIAGVGGQGSILAAVILGKAAVRYDRKFATQTQAYSSELRGGFAAAWIIIADEPVEYPRVIHPDVLVAQAQDSINRFAYMLKPEGLLIFDSDIVQAIPESIKLLYSVEATSMARSDLKAPVTANIIMLGALCKVTSVVNRSALEKAVCETVPRGGEQLNLKAFALGFNNVKSV